MTQSARFDTNVCEEREREREREQNTMIDQHAMCEKILQNRIRIISNGYKTDIFNTILYFENVN
jgi:hypothetical protein